MHPADDLQVIYGTFLLTGVIGIPAVYIRTISYIVTDFHGTGYLIVLLLLEQKLFINRSYLQISYGYHKFLKYVAVHRTSMYTPKK